MNTPLAGFLRADGRKGVRNVVAVAYLVECAHHVAREIVDPFRDAEVHLIGFPGCYPNAYDARCSSACARIPTWARRSSCRWVAKASTSARSARPWPRAGDPCTRSASRTPAARARRSTPAGPGSSRRWSSSPRSQRVPMALDELIVGTICGGSDATVGPHRQSGDGRRLRPPGGRRRHRDLRGDRGAHRHGAAHGRARRDARAGR